MGKRDGAEVRALASHQCGPGSIQAWCHMWVDFVVGSRLAPRVFLQQLFSFVTSKANNNERVLHRNEIQCGTVARLLLCTLPQLQ